MLKEKSCVPCSVGAIPLEEELIQEYMNALSDGWENIDNSIIRKSYKLKDFKEALMFVNQVGKLAEEEGHHPDIKLGWGYVEIKCMTKKIMGLHENDFILAAKIDEIKMD